MLGEPIERITGTLPTGEPYEVDVYEGFAVYRGAKPYEELEFPPPPEGHAEYFDWAWKDERVQKDYAGHVVAVRHRKVWGAGKTGDDAIKQALQKPGCPPGEDLVLIDIPGPEIFKGPRED